MIEFGSTTLVDFKVYNYKVVSNSFNDDIFLLFVF
jgi:hypothetical protein